MQTLSVDLPSGERYPIHIGAGALSLIPAVAPTHVAVVSNPTVFALYGEPIMENLRATGKQPFAVMIEDGEAHKNMQTLSSIMDALMNAKMRRDGGIIALGGGVIGDLAGFAAAIYMRGIAVLQAPTTLLAQVDAAIGGKTGVNHAQGKNMIGAFCQPKAVFCDISVLSSLPDREYRAGLAEVVKYGLLGDADFFVYLEDCWQALLNRDEAVVTKIVEKSAQCKVMIICADERETSGQRALLNLGHTFAHAIETTSGYGKWLHGEAVASGLLAAARLSELRGAITAAETTRLRELLQRLQLPVTLPEETDDDALLAAMVMDKKHTQAGNRFVVLRALGDAAVDFIDDNLVRQTLHSLR